MTDCGSTEQLISENKKLLEIIHVLEEKIKLRDAELIRKTNIINYYKEVIKTLKQDITKFYDTIENYTPY